MQKRTSFDVVEEGLAKARASIREAILYRNHSNSGKQEHFIPKGSIYRNPHAFHQLSSKDFDIFSSSLLIIKVLSYGHSYSFIVFFDVAENCS